MQKAVFTYLAIFLLPILAWGQDEFHINDEIELYNVFSVVDSKMLDTSTNRFHDAKRNVLRYYSENLTFDIDSTATLYSCREYMEINSHATKKERKKIERENLKYEFFISFKIHKNIPYFILFRYSNACSLCFKMDFWNKLR